jgi:branched-chain amino acid transport system ATP-binding protein
MLKLDKITVSYGKIVALNDVTLSVDKGEIIGIIGANGAGKTTLINTVSGILRPVKGAVTFLDERIDNLPAWKIVSKGIVQIPEGRKLFPKMTVLENMELGAYLLADKKEVARLIDEMFTTFPVLKDRKHQRAGTLSGGEQQMLAIARGLMSNPQLLMFDEPSMGLAPILVEKVFEIINQISKKGVTILLVEQNAKKSLQIAHRAYVLETGKIIFTGTGKELSQNELVKKAYLGESL